MLEHIKDELMNLEVDILRTNGNSVGILGWGSTCLKKC